MKIVSFCLVALALSACSSGGSQVQGVDTGEVDFEAPSPGDPAFEPAAEAEEPETVEPLPQPQPLPVTEANAPSHPLEMQRTWDAAEVRFVNEQGELIELNGSSLDNQTFAPGVSKAVVIYLHGCSGFWSGSDFRNEWFAEQGFVSVAVNSFARTFYPESCNLDTLQGWQYKPTIAMRQFDLGFTLEQLYQLSWVNTDRLFIYGFSEGGVIAANFSSESANQQVNARVIESWNCSTIPWPEYQGMDIPESQPVLTLFASQDPWLQDQALSVSCSDFISNTNGSQAFLFESPPLSTQHPLLEASEVQELVLNFLLSQSNTLP